MIEVNHLDIGITREFIDQMPGLFYLVDLQSKFLISNATFVKWGGFSFSETLLSKSYEDMSCKAAELCATFAEEDSQVITRNKPLKKIGYYCYANDEWKILCGEKYPIKNKNNEIIAVAAHFNDVTHCPFIEVSRFLEVKKMDESVGLARKQFGLAIEDSYPGVYLPERQVECLFFLLRGKTAKDIAKILKLSYRTVECYIDEIKRRLNCLTKAELIEKSIAEGYLNILPRIFL